MSESFLKNNNSFVIAFLKKNLYKKKKFVNQNS